MFPNNLKKWFVHIFLGVLISGICIGCQTDNDLKKEKEQTVFFLDSLIRSIKKTYKVSPHDSLCRLSLNAAHIARKENLWFLFDNTMECVYKTCNQSNENAFKSLDSFLYLSIPDSSKVKVKSLQALLKNKNKEYQESMSLFLEYVEYCEEHPSFNPARYPYSILSNLYTRNGDYQRASLFNARVLDIIKGSEDTSQISKHFYREGFTQYYLENYEAALHSYDISLGYDSSRLEKTFIRKAESLLSMDSIQAAKKYLDQLQKQALSDELKIQYRSVLSNYFDIKGQKALSIASLQKAISLAKSIFPPHDRELGRLYALLAQRHLKYKDYDSCFKSCDSSLAVFYPSLTNLTGHDWLAITPSSELWIPELLAIKGTAYSDLFKSTHKGIYFKKAQQFIEKAIALYAHVNSNYKEEKSSGMLTSKYVYPLYEKLLELKTLSFENESEDVISQLFDLVNNSNSFFLKQEINLKKAFELSNIDAHTQLELATFERKIRDIYEKLAIFSDQNQKSLLESELLYCKRQEEKIIDSLKLFNPKINGYLSSLKNRPLSFYQNIISDSTAILQFFYGQKKIYTLVTKKGSSRLFINDNLDLINNAIDTLQNCLVNFDFVRKEPHLAERSFLNSSHFLYKNLLEKPLSFANDNNNITSLLIQPSGRLNSIPFDILTFEKSRSWSDIDNYILSDYSISYPVNLNSIFWEKNSNEENNWLGIGIDFKDEIFKDVEKYLGDTILSKPSKTIMRNKKLQPLHFSKTEMQTINEKMGGKILFNNRATKKNLYTHINQFNLIHITSHALADVDYPQKSVITLYPQEKSIESSILSAQEIGALNLSCDQMVLSACETALGRDVLGEGILSLTRYFLLAGCKGVIASHWSVPDQMSFLLMREFYQNLIKGESKATALRNAKLTCLSNDELFSPTYMAPCYWAAFSVYGDASPIFSTIE